MNALEILKADLIGQLDYRYEQPVVVAGVTLDGAAKSQADFTKLGATLSAARGLLAGPELAAFDASTITLKDAAGNFVPVSRLAALQLILGYADAMYARWVSIEQGKAAIAAAETEEAARAALTAAQA